MSQQTLFPLSGLSDSSPADSPAPISPSRAKAWDSSEESGVPYGSSFSGSSESSSRLGSSLRTFLLCACEALTRCSLAWRKQATPRGRWWWVLGRSAHRTGETASGSLGGEWATPRASENENRTTRITPSRASGKHGQYLAVQALGEWPTPTAEPYGSNQGGSAGREGQPKRPSLEGAAREWPTPTARDWRSTQASPETHGKNARPLSEVAGLDWPTPKEADGRSKGNAGDRKSPGLDALARSGQLDAENLSTPGSRPGSLNPDWVEALMGAPPGWTALPDETVSELWATRTRGSSRT